MGIVLRIISDGLLSDPISYVSVLIRVALCGSSSDVGNAVPGQTDRVLSIKSLERPRIAITAGLLKAFFSFLVFE